MLFSIQPVTEYGTLLSKVFICTPLSSDLIKASMYHVELNTTILPCKQDLTGEASQVRSELCSVQFVWGPCLLFIPEFTANVWQCCGSILLDVLYSDRDSILYHILIFRWIEGYRCYMQNWSQSNYWHYWINHARLCSKRWRWVCYINMCSICQYVVTTSGLEFAKRVLAFHFCFSTECRFTEEKNIKQKLAIKLA